MIEAKYIELSCKIEDGIKKGVWKGRLPGIAKLGRELSVDSATVLKAFRVLANKGLLTIQGTRGTYITPHSKRPQHKVIGCIGLKPDNVIYSAEFEEMEKEAAKRGYNIVGLAHGRQLFAHGTDILLKFPFDGYIFMYSSLTAEIAAFLQGNGINFVSCNKPVSVENVNCVDFAAEKTFEKAMKYFVGLGHRRIAYFDFYNPNYPTYNYRERILNTYKKVMAEARLPFDESLFVMREVEYEAIHEKQFQKNYGRDCVKSLKNNRPTAVLTHLGMGYGVLEEMNNNNLKVPDDMSIMVYNSRFYNDDDDFFTTLYLDYKKKSLHAVNLLLDLVNDPWEGAKIELLESKIIVKKSTAQIKTPEKK